MDTRVQQRIQEESKKIQDKMLKIKNKIMIMSGKGGVGKSTVSVNLAVGLSLEGKKVGILDADIHGPNIPQMLGVEGSKITDIRKPYEISSTLSAVSLSFYMDSSDKPIVFRGPAKSSAIREILSNVDWGDLDYLIVDLPPGTGDEQLTIAQSIGDVDGTIIVSTPQDVAVLDVRKSIEFSKLINVPILGLVENMSGLVCPHCNETIQIFNTGAVEKAIADFKIELLEKVPMDPKLANAGDTGKSLFFETEESIVKDKFKNIVKRIIEKTTITV